MKSFLFASLLLLALPNGAYCASVSADSPYLLHSESKNPSDQSNGNVKWATFLDRDVENKQGDNLGTVTGLAIDMKNGRIAAVVVTTGSFLGLGKSRTVGVPPGAFTNFKEGGEHGTLVLDMSKERFKTAPELTSANWNAYFQGRNLVSAFLYFGVAPYFATRDKKGYVQAMSLGSVKSIGQVVGLPVRDAHSVLGHVSAIRVDAASERVMYVLVHADETVSSQSEIMASEVQLNTAQNALIFDVARQGGAPFGRPAGGTDSPRAAKSSTTQTTYPATVP